MAKLKLIDFSRLENHFDGDLEILGDLVEIFKDTYAESLNGMEQAIHECDHSKLEHHAHTFKGMVSNFQAEKLREISFELEVCGREQGDFATAEACLSELKKQITDFISELNQLGEILNAA